MSISKSSRPIQASYCESFGDCTKNPGNVANKLRKEAEPTLQKIRSSAKKTKYINYDLNHPETLRKVSFISTFLSFNMLFSVTGCIVPVVTDVVKRGSISTGSLFFSCVGGVLLGYIVNRVLPVKYSTYGCSLLGKGLLVSSQNCISSIASKVFNNSEKKRIEKGVCRGAVEWFNYLFSATNGVFQAEEAQLMRITKLFFHGAPKEAAFIQSQCSFALSEGFHSDCALRVFFNRADRKKNDFSEGLKSLPDGAYITTISLSASSLKDGHAIWLFKKKNLAYIFDPNFGLRKIEGPKLEEKILEKLWIIQDMMGITQNARFEFSLSRGVSQYDLKFKPTLPCRVIEMKPGFFVLKNYCIKSLNIFSGILFFVINRFIEIICILLSRKTLQKLADAEKRSIQGN